DYYARGQDNDSPRSQPTSQQRSRATARRDGICSFPSASDRLMAPSKIWHRLATTAAQLLVSCVVVLGMTTTASASIEFAVNKDTTATGVRLTAVKAKDHTTCQNTCNGRSDCKAYS